MRIEIDTSNPASLKRLEKELRIALSTVQHAIREQEAQAQPQLPIEEFSVRPDSANGVSGAQEEEALAYKLVCQVVETLPSELTSSDIISRTQKADKTLSRGAIRNAITKLVKTEKLAIQNVGRGRRPTEYLRQ